MYNKDVNNLLAQYTEKAKGMTPFELRYAIKDVKETMELWKGEPMTHPYNQQLWAEFDAFTVALYKAEKP